MNNQELDVKEVLNVVNEAKKQVAEIYDAVDPVSSTRESLRKVEKYLNDIEREVVQTLPAKRKKGIAEKVKSCSTLLMPVAKLLLELWQQHSK